MRALQWILDRLEALYRKVYFGDEQAKPEEEKEVSELELDAMTFVWTVLTFVGTYAAVRWWLG